MTPDEFRAARLDLDYSTARLAKRLGISSGRTIRRYEAGERPVNPAAVKMLKMLVWLNACGIDDPDPVARRKATSPNTGFAA